MKERFPGQVRKAQTAPFDLQQPHRRFNPLIGEWILVSPQRTQRPWLGQTEKVSAPCPQIYDPNCYMCPGNVRAAGARNPNDIGTYSVDNDYPALVPGTPTGELHERDLIVAAPEAGICRVLCFSPRHDLTLATMPTPSLRKVVDAWAEHYEELGCKESVRYVQIFENHGAMMGGSNPHPHGQIWASSSIPNEPARELAAQQRYHQSHSSCLLCDYLALECQERERMIFENEHFAVLVPFWAIWPFETLVLPKRHIASIPELSECERDALADALKRLTTRYDRLFEVSFPYSMGFHQRPTNGDQYPEWHLHAHFFPPLLRSASVRKFMVGYEMLGTPQRDITAETAAARLREVGEAS
jgi:UDPglucose--hexose-1-phosphate uridylyltransferase